ncbi:MAG: GNAT family N-acetyltransferase [Clostridia bacterium]|nr:GNAT family N-acetyltransferase [Clostridia bacterium]
MIREMTENDKTMYFEMADKFYHSPAVSHSVPKMCFQANFTEMIGAKNYLEGYIIEEGNEVVGFAVVAKTFASEVGGLCVWVEDIYVKPEFRGQGLGREFFNFLQKKYLWTAKRLRLEVSSENSRAITLYKRLGFSEIPYKQLFKDL